MSCTVQAQQVEEEEEKRKVRKRKKSRIRELEDIRAELAAKELALLDKERYLMDKDQNISVLQEEVRAVEH